MNSTPAKWINKPTLRLDHWGRRAAAQQTTTPPDRELRQCQWLRELLELDDRP